MTTFQIKAAYGQLSTNEQHVDRIREVLKVHTSQSKKPVLNLESQQPQYGESSLRYLCLSLTICNC